MSLSIPAIRPARRSASEVPVWLLAAAACVALALVIRIASPTNSDVSWLLDVGSQWLDGRRPYVDIIEVNPPASILIYMPAVLVARATGLTPELATILMVTAGAVAALLLAGTVLLRGGLLPPEKASLVLCASLAIALILPADSFAQREHIAVLAGLPLLAMLAVRLGGRPPTFAIVVLAGLAGGVAVAIKPIFVLAFVGPVLCLLLSRGWRAVLGAAELWTASLVAAGYGLGVLILVPAFRNEVLPMVMAAYVPLRRPLTDLAVAPVNVCWVVALCSALLGYRYRGRDPFLVVLVLASIGFEACYLMQGKGFLYHALPAVTLALFAVVWSFWGAPGPVARCTEPGVLLGASAFVLGVLVLGQRLDLDREAPGLASAVRQVADHPKMVVISSDIAVGHPFVRDVHGQWVGSLASNWLAGCIARLEARPLSPETRATLDRLGEDERTRVARDITQGDPDVILVDDDRWMAWVARSAALTDALAAYRRQGQFGAIILLTRSLGTRPATLAVSKPGGASP